MTRPEWRAESGIQRVAAWGWVGDSPGWRNAGIQLALVTRWFGHNERNKPCSIVQAIGKYRVKIKAPEPVLIR